MGNFAAPNLVVWPKRPPLYEHLMKKVNDTKKRIIAAGSQLFRRRGYFGTGLSEILKESGAPKGSFYFHFPKGKDQLAAACVDAAAEDVVRGLEAAAAHSKSVAEFVDRLVDGYERMLLRSDYGASSLLTNISLDVAPTNEAISARLQAGYRRWHKIIADFCTHLLGSRQAGSDMAVLIISSLEGALSLCRTERSTAPLKAVARRLRENAEVAEKTTPQ